MKRFFSLMLVALLLVSALPFAAFADGYNATIYVNVNGETKYSDVFTLPAEADAAVAEAYARTEAAYMAFFDAYADYTVEKTANNDFVISFVGATAPVDPCADGHDYGDWTVTKEATCGEVGEKVRVCKDNAEHKDTKSIPATGEHTYVNHVCTVCGDKEGQGLTFHYLNAAGNWTTSIATIRSGDTITLPNIPDVSTKDHIGWNTKADGTGDSITSSTKWYTDMADEFWAIYEVDTTEDNIVDLTVYAHYYVDGVYHHKEKLFVKEFEKTAKNTMFTWLYSNDGLQKTTEALAEEGYQWTSKIFYDYYDDGAVTEADLKSDGNKSVYVKVTSKKAIEATVLLYVHTKKEHANDRVISMSGFTAGDYVSYDDVLTAVKKYYTGSKLSIGNLYNESDWEDLLAGLSSSGSRSVKVETNGTTEIHIILSNATAKSGSKADSSNPKTGDYITIAVGTMVLAAAALVTVTELKKRKMI